MTFSVVDLFAGAGGLSFGFKQAGFKLIAAVESSKHHTESYGNNFPGVKVHHKDIADVMPESFMGVADVVVGAPPYEAFLSTNPNRKEDPLDRLYEDPHGELVLHFIDFVAAARPKAFVLELHPDAGEDIIMNAIGEEFQKAGFGPLYVSMLNAAEFGATTERHSIFISNVHLEPVPPEEPGMPVGALVEEVREGTQNHEIDTLSSKRQEEILGMDVGDFLEPLEMAGSPDPYPNWFRLVPEATAPPMYGFSRFVHPFEDRGCTIREMARLAGFPDTFVFMGGRNLQHEAVGNAVPPPLARALANEVGVALSQESSTRAPRTV